MADAEPQRLPRPRPPGLDGRPRLADRDAPRRRAPRRRSSRTCIPLDEVTLHLPDRGRRLRRLLRERAPRDATSARSSAPTTPALPPNWKHLPIGYHGRAGTVVVTRHRRRPPDRPAQGPERRRRRLRPEHPPRHRGRARLRRRRRDRARLTRRRSTRPPTTSSASSSSTTGARATSRPGSTSRSARSSASPSRRRSRRGSPRSRPSRRPASPFRDSRTRRSLPYLRGRRASASTSTSRCGSTARVVSRPEHAGMYWSPAQMLAHLTVNGASLRDGDLFGSGTISGPTRETPWQPARADLERHRAADARRRHDPRLPRGRRHVTMTAWAPGPGRRADRPRRGHRHHPPRPLSARAGVRPQWMTTGAASAWSSRKCDSSCLRGRKDAGIRSARRGSRRRGRCCRRRRRRRPGPSATAAGPPTSSTSAGLCSRRDGRTRQRPRR